MKAATNQTSKKRPIGVKNPIETFKDLGSNMVQDAAQSIGGIGGGVVDQLAGQYDYYDQEDDYYDEFAPQMNRKKEQPQPVQQKEFTVFNAREHYERENVQREIRELTGQVKQELEAFKRDQNALMSEVKDAEKLVFETAPETPGVYHVRFLELIMKLLQSLRAKIGESRTWLEAMTSKKKKRGSAFAVLSKKKGTQFSLSQELQSARNVQ